MATGILGNLKVGISVAIGDASKAFKSLRGDLNKFVAGFNSGLGGFAAKAAGIAGAVIGIKSAFDGLTKGLTLAADLEMADVAFRTMLGSGEAATKMLSELKKFAAQTPFEFPEVQDAAKSMIAFGFPAESVVDTLRKLGDVGSLLGVPLSEMAYLFGTARVQGRLFTADIRQFQTRGVPIVDALATTLGVTTNEVSHLVETGKVGFTELQRAFDELTKQGGRFAGGMATASQTTAGLFSTLKDTINEQLAAVGATIIQTFDLKGVIQGLIEFTAAAGTVFRDMLGGMTSGLSGITAESQVTGSTVAKAFEFGALAVAKLVDIAGVVKLAFLKVQQVITSVIGVIVENVASAVALMAELPDALGGGAFAGAADFLQTYSEDLNRLADTQQAAFDKALVAPTATENVKAAFAKIQEEMKRNAEATAAVTATAASDSAQSAVENVSAGAFAGISAITAGLLNAQAVVENIPKEKTITVRQETIAAAQRGSAEAESIISKALRGPDRQIKILEETKRIEERQSVNLDKIAQALSKATGAKLVGI